MVKILEIFKLHKLKFVAAAIAVIIVATLALSYALSFSKTSEIKAQNVTPEIKDRYAVLSKANTDVCRFLGNYLAIHNYISSLDDKSYLQGSCCTPMNLNHYAAQITGLRNYSYVPSIPRDPYNVSAAQAKQMLGYYDDISLNASQNATFNEAASMTDDNSWCCCQCWAWYTHAGLAKYLITNYNFNATQVATVIDLEDCCGG